MLAFEFVRKCFFQGKDFHNACNVNHQSSHTVGTCRVTCMCIF